MFCNHCGQPIPDASDFCPCCGAILSSGGSRGERAPMPQFQKPEPSSSQPRYRQELHQRSQPQYRQPTPRPRRRQAPPLSPKQLWIERDDGLGALMRHFHAQNHGRWKTIAMASAIVCGLSLLLPWYTFSFLGFDFLDFLNIFGDGIRSADWLIIAIACVAVVVALYLGHPMWSLVACVFLCYFTISNLTSLFWTLGFMHPTLGFFLYALATAVTTYGCLCAGGLEELNLFLPGPTPQAGFTYPDPTDPHIPRGDGC